MVEQDDQRQQNPPVVEKEWVEQILVVFLAEIFVSTAVLLFETPFTQLLFAIVEETLHQNRIQSQGEHE